MTSAASPTVGLSEPVWARLPLGAALGLLWFGVFWLAGMAVLVLTVPVSTFANQWLVAVGFCGVMAASAFLGSPPLLARHRAGWLCAVAVAGALAWWWPAQAGLSWVLLLGCALLWRSAQGLGHGLPGVPGTGPSSAPAAGLVCTVVLGAVGVAALGQALLAVIQIHFPDGCGQALACASYGRATGQLRQPNHLSTLLIWGLICAVAWAQGRRLGRWGGLAGVAALCLMAYGVVLTGSRTGLLGVLMLAIWGGLDRALTGRTRLALVALVPAYALMWWAATHAPWVTQAVGVQVPTAGSDVSSSRFAIWANTLALIRLHPWAGVGWGEFNFAWTLTPFPHRPVAFFDHTHNLPLQWAVELGLPAALGLCALLAWGLWVAFSRARQHARKGDMRPMCAWMLVAVVMLHSLLEYPLWYTYFLLPCAWAWGFAMRRPAPPPDESMATPSAARPSTALAPAYLAASGLMLGLALWVARDYWVVADIYAPPPGAPSLAWRVERGMATRFFAAQAAYASATVDELHERPADALPAIQVASHHLLDTRLMMAWALALEDAGETDQARHLAARLREFRNPASVEFFKPCDDAQLASKAFQCQAPRQAWRFQDFR